MLLQNILCLYLVDCEWSDWQNDGKCDNTCGQGKQLQSRTKTKYEVYGGKCDGGLTQYVSCESYEDCPGK